MLTSLGKAFGDAYKLVQPSAKAGDIQAPYAVKNDTGSLIAITIDKHLQVSIFFPFFLLIILLASK